MLVNRSNKIKDMEQKEVIGYWMHVCQVLKSPR